MNTHLHPPFRPSFFNTMPALKALMDSESSTENFSKDDRNSTCREKRSSCVDDGGGAGSWGWGWGTPKVEQISVKKCSKANESRLNRLAGAWNRRFEGSNIHPKHHLRFERFERLDVMLRSEATGWPAHGWPSASACLIANGLVPTRKAWLAPFFGQAFCSWSHWPHWISVRPRALMG